jgi:uncharacterized membrane protein
MSQETAGMIVAGLAALAAGLILLRSRLTRASNTDRILLLGPVFSAVALAIFAFEHFLAAADLAPIVPHYLPFPLFWTYFVGVALLAAAISFIAWRYVRLSASLLTLLFLIIVATVDMPNLPASLHDRFFWILTVRETAFASGATILAVSQSPGSRTASLLAQVARVALACIFVFYAVQQFLHPHNVPGVPLEKIIPAWFPTPVLLSDLVGLTLLVAGPCLLLPRTRALAAATAGSVLTLLTVFFYIPILILEVHTPLAVEGVNYVGDTLLFAATALLAGFTPNHPPTNQ